MSEVYALTRKVHGPAGHGEPGAPYIALAEDGNGYVLGEPIPVFASRESAERRLAEFGEYTSFEITPLTVKEYP